MMRFWRFVVFIHFTALSHVSCQESCQFYTRGNSDLKTEIEESAPIGSPVLRLRVFPRERFSLQADSDPKDVDFFTFEEINSEEIVVKLAKSLKNLNDQQRLKNTLKFRLVCVGANSTEIVHVPAEVSIQDVNNHTPKFRNAPYALEIDELTPVGLTIFKGISAVDDDRPETENSRLSYSITGGNIGEAFIMADSGSGTIVLNRPLDFDDGTRNYSLEIKVKDHGFPSLEANSKLNIKVLDSDDQNPAFTQDLYRIRIEEKADVTGSPIREMLPIKPQIKAFDKDRAINSPIRYSILSGNDKRFFDIDSKEGNLYVVEEIDREKLEENLFSLQIQAVQVDNPLRQSTARVDIEVVDINDNLPEFNSDTYNVSIFENVPKDFKVIQVQAKDADVDENASFKYILEDELNAFTINERTGWISVKNQDALDREINSHILVKVFAEEKIPSVRTNAEPHFALVDINLMDTNDNDPKFIPSRVYQFDVSELANAGDVIGRVVAKDPDLGENGNVFYTLSNDTAPEDKHFDVDFTNGSIYVLEAYAIAENKPRSYTFFINAADRPNSPRERRYSLAVVNVKVIDVNNKAPIFVGAPYFARIAENLPIGTPVHHIIATDSDLQTKLIYEIGSNGSKSFSIDPETGLLSTASVLDYEETNNYSIVVDVSDGLHTSSASVIVEVIDINDHVPIFEHSTYNFQIVEELEPQVIVGSVMAEDGDGGDNGLVTYAIIDDSHNGSFGIDRQGTLTTLKRLDREVQSEYQLIVAALDSGTPVLSVKTIITVTVIDINDNVPLFNSVKQFTEVPEEVDPPFAVITVSASDLDEGENGEVHYAITSGNDGQAFTINETTGELFTQKRLDYEMQTLYGINITAYNVQAFEGRGKINLDISTVHIIVSVKDRHDSIPKFEQQFYEFDTSEMTEVGTILGRVNATRTDISHQQRVVYWIQGGKTSKLGVNRTTGDIFLKKPIDYDPPAAEHSLTYLVIARDVLSFTRFNASVNITVNIADVNDNKPTFEEDSYQIHIPEDAAINVTLPLELNVSDLDDDLNGKISKFSIVTQQDYFGIDSINGEISLRKELDYESEQRFILQIAAVDGGTPQQTGSVIVIVNVGNVNEFAPKFANDSLEFWTEPNFPVGGLVGQVLAKDEDGDAVKYNILDGDTDLFRIDSNSGEIYSVNNIGGQYSYNLKILAVDDGLPKPQTSTVQVVVHVHPANNHSPFFSKPLYDAIVRENDTSGHAVVQVSARDEDLLRNKVTYSIIEGNPSGIFVINSTTGSIFVDTAHASHLDYDTQNVFPLAVQATDDHDHPRSSVTLVMIVVEDVNNHPPVFSQQVYNASLKENSLANTCFIKVHATSGDTVDTVRYSLMKPTQPFYVNSSSGQICSNRSLDREKISEYELTVIAFDGQYTAFASVRVNVIDENDNAPKFSKNIYQKVLPVDAAEGISLVNLHAVDPDGGYNGQVAFWTPNPYGIFSVDAESGEVTLKRALQNNEVVNGSRLFSLQVFAQDHGFPPRSSEASVLIQFKTKGGKSPVFDQFVYDSVLPEGIAPLQVVTVSAHVPDVETPESSNLVYRIAEVRGVNTSDAFKIDEKQGIITLRRPLDFNKSRAVHIVVEAQEHGKHTLPATTLVQLKVADVNNHAPQFYPFPESIRIPVSTKLDDVIYQLHASDEDQFVSGEEKFSYGLEGTDGMFSVDAATGEVAVKKRLLPLIKNLTVNVRDQGFPPMIIEAILMIEVFDEKAPRMQKFPEFREIGYLQEFHGPVLAETHVTNVQAVVPAGDNVLYNISYSTCGDVFKIHSDTGRLYTTHSLNQPICHVLVKAYNEESHQFYVEVGVTVKSKLLATSCPNFPLKYYRASVIENAPVGELVLGDIQVNKPELYKLIEYKIEEDSSAGKFYLETRNNVALLKIQEKIDRESMLAEVYSLKVVAVNGDCSDWVSVDIYVVDVNDNIPSFSHEKYIVRVMENSPAGTEIFFFTASDPDIVDIGKISYSLAEDDKDDYFILNSETGVLTMKKPLDREEVSALQLVVNATDSGNNTGSVILTIIVEDENDIIPQFPNGTMTFSLEEGPSSLKAAFEIRAVDGDEGMNKALRYFILDGDSKKQFSMRNEENKGVITVLKELDREDFAVEGTASIQLIVGVRDRGKPPLSSTATVSILIEDINDEVPQFTQKEFKEAIPETAEIGSLVTQISATDGDSDELTTLLYTFGNMSARESIPFLMDNKTGEVFVVKALDFAERSVYNLSVVVTDGEHSNKVHLMVYIQEEIERTGRSYEPLKYLFQVPENVVGLKVGQLALTTNKRKLDRPKKYIILDKEADEMFRIENDGTIFTKVKLDREKREIYSFSVLQEDMKRFGEREVCKIEVTVEDVNDESPYFTRSYSGKILENSSPGTKVKIDPPIEALDKDSGINSVVIYFLSGFESHLFEIDSLSGVITWAGFNNSHLDREKKEKYNLEVGAMDLDNLTATTNLSIAVVDINDNAPSFIHGDLEISVPETVETGTKITRVTAFDHDGPGKFSEVGYSIVSNTPAFKVDPISGEVFLLRVLEPETSHRVNISAMDGGRLTSYVSLTVHSLDVNDHHPKFMKSTYKFNVPEGRYFRNAHALGVVLAEDEDMGDNAQIKYSLVSKTSEGLPFTIDQHLGILNVSGDLDREAQSSYQFNVFAEDFGVPSLNSTVEVLIIVEDVNDEPPRFVGDPYFARVSENKDPGQWVAQVKAVDFDSNATGNGQISYKLLSGHDDKFFIDSKDGSVWTLAILDYEKVDSYNVTVGAFDSGKPKLNSTAMIYVRVTDTVDIVPNFAKSTFTIEVAENAPPGTIVYTLDAGSTNFYYMLQEDDSNGTFKVGNFSGEITLLRHLDSEWKSQYKMTVISRDSSSPPNWDRTQVNILVGAGQGLRAFPKRQYTVNVLENQPAPLVIFDFNATDELAGKHIDYKISSNDFRGLFKVDSSTGRLSVSRMLDREKVSKYQLKISAEKKESRGRSGKPQRDAGSEDFSHISSDEALVVINVLDVNDNPPIFVNNGRPIIVAASVNANFGSHITRVVAFDSDEGINGRIRYEVLTRDFDDSLKFHANAATGEIRSLQALAIDGTSGKVYTFDVKAQDLDGQKEGHSATATVFVHVLADIKLTVISVGKPPLFIEENAMLFTGQLSNMTGLDVNICKIIPRAADTVSGKPQTDVYIYAVNRKFNNLVEVDEIVRTLRDKLPEIQKVMDSYEVMEVHDINFLQKSAGLTVTELALLSFGFVIFVATIVGIVCAYQKRRSQLDPSQISLWDDHQKLFGIRSTLTASKAGSSFADASIDTQRNSCSCIIHSNRDSGDSQSYKDSLSSASTLDLEKSRSRMRQRPSSEPPPLPPPPSANAMGLKTAVGSMGHGPFGPNNTLDSSSVEQGRKIKEEMRLRDIGSWRSMAHPTDDDIDEHHHFGAD